MGTPGKRPRRIRRTEAERLLDSGSVAGGPVDAGRLELARILDAVTGPALPEEVADEAAAVGLFGRQYELGRNEPSTGRSLLPRPTPRRAIGLRLATALGVLLFGGLAAGAETGVLPAALQEQAHALFSSFGVPPPDGAAPAASQRPRRGTGTASPAGANGSGAPRVAGSGLADPNGVIGWCHSYDNGKGKPSAKELAALSAAAGGTDKIAAFCAAVLGPSPSPQATDQPGHQGKPAKSHKPAPPKPSHK
jgi:hypothetical protein